MKNYLKAENEGLVQLRSSDFEYPFAVFHYDVQESDPVYVSFHKAEINADKEVKYSHWNRRVKVAVVAISRAEFNQIKKEAVK
jgi:hypothetical protein